MEERIIAYLRHRMPDADDVRIDGLSRIHGGSSQETYRFHATWSEAGAAVDRNLILRRAPPSGLVVAADDIEYDVYAALAGSGLPLPRVYFMETDAAWLDRAFFVMDLCAGKPGHFYQGGDPYEGHGAAIGRQFWQHLGRLAAIDHQAVGLGHLRGGDRVAHPGEGELDHWEAILDANERVVEPIVRGALRWLRRNPPPAPARTAIVHGDYRPGNFLFTSDGRISAILDWEMCHIGDPLEDVAWAINPFWPMTRHLPLDEGIAEWEQASGLAVDRTALDWWRMFAAVKACAIWTTAEASFTSGKSREMVVAMSGLRAGHFHRNEILTRMAERGAMG